MAGGWVKLIPAVLEAYGKYRGEKEQRKIEDKLIDAKTPKDTATQQAPYMNEYLARIFPTLFKEALSVYGRRQEGYGGEAPELGPLYELLSGISPSYSGIGQPGAPQFLGPNPGSQYNPFSQGYGQEGLAGLLSGLEQGGNTSNIGPASQETDSRLLERLDRLREKYTGGAGHPLGMEPRLYHESDGGDSPMHWLSGPFAGTPDKYWTKGSQPVDSMDFESVGEWKGGGPLSRIPSGLGSAVGTINPAIGGLIELLSIVGQRSGGGRGY